MTQSQQLERTLNEMKKLLKFAYDNMAFVVPEPDPESGYDFCQICGNLEWKHEPNCKGVTWKTKVEEYIK